MQSPASSTIFPKVLSAVGLGQTKHPPPVPQPPASETTDEPYAEFEIPDWFLKISAIVLIPLEVLFFPVIWVWETSRLRKEDYRRKREQCAETT
jgi:hypothetical protein